MRIPRPFPAHLPAMVAGLAIAAALGLAWPGHAALVDGAPHFASMAEARAAMRTALQGRAAAEARSLRLERDATAARDAAERTARTAAAMAARVQQAEAGIAAAGARLALIDSERANLRERLGREQAPLVRLTAVLQQFARRPTVLSLLRPGTIGDVVHTRALLASAVPRIDARTDALRARIARMRLLREQARQAMAVLRSEQGRLATRQQQLAVLETRQRLASRQAIGTADREAERALALAEQARDLDELVGELGRAGQLRAELAALPGPTLRPAQPGLARPAPSAAASEAGARATGEDMDQRLDGGAAAPAAPAPRPYLLPVTGTMVHGFGAPQAGGLSKGLALAPGPGAQVVAPAAGRVAYAGPYRGYGRIVIIEHLGGWTSLVTGLARIDVRVGQQLVGGAPLGVGPRARPLVTLELRRSGEPVDPVPFVG